MRCTECVNFTIAMMNFDVHSMYTVLTLYCMCVYVAIGSYIQGSKMDNLLVDCVCDFQMVFM